MKIWMVVAVGAASFTAAGYAIAAEHVQLTLDNAVHQPAETGNREVPEIDPGSSPTDTQDVVLPVVDATELEMPEFEVPVLEMPEPLFPEGFEFPEPVTLGRLEAPSAPTSSAGEAPSEVDESLLIDDFLNAIGRPVTGELLDDHRSVHGDAVFTVEGHPTHDAVIAMAPQGYGSLFKIYVRAGETAVMHGVPHFVYDVYFALGSDWEAATETFAEAASIEKFDDSLDFTWTQQGNRYVWSNWTVELTETLLGNAGTSDVGRLP